MLWNVDLWSEMERFRREIDGFFKNIDRSTGATTYPLVNVYDNKEDIVVTAELPGVTKEKVTITYADGVLTIKGDLEPLKSVKNMSVVRQERSVGKFEKTLRLPTKVDQNKISASFNNGILTITLPKTEEVRPKTIAIEAK